MQSFRQSKAAGIAVIAAIYAAAAALGAWVFTLLPYPTWLSLLVADVAATVFTFVFSVALGNASVYDPYWSVQPIVILTAFAVMRGAGLAGWIVLASVWVWGVRLTANWAYTFHGLVHQDWRYTMLRRKTGAFYPFVNFFGIHMVPTLIVYGCTLPGVFIVEEGCPANAGSFVGLAVCLGCAALQLSADVQMQRFRKQGSGGLIRTGLWKHARHPNYLGEILMWWGVALQAVSVMPQRWWLIAGAASNTVLFLAASIPMADRRQSQKPGYAEYKAQTRSLLPIPKTH